MTTEDAVAWLREHHCTIQTIPGEDGPEDGLFAIEAICYDEAHSVDRLRVKGPDLVALVEQLEADHFAQHGAERADLGRTIVERREARRQERERPTEPQAGAP